METLGKVTQPLPEDRGPDVSYSISVPRDWFGFSAALLVKLPRMLSCAVCEGGGCDRCERRGALELREKDAPAEVLQVQLAALGEGGGQLLRIPNFGAHAGSPEQSRGCLMLRILPGELSRGVERLPFDGEAAADAPQLSPWLLAALALVVLLIIVAVVLWT